MSKTYVTMIDIAEGHGAFPRHKRMCQALISAGHTVICLAPPGYEAVGVKVINFVCHKLPNYGFVGLYFKLLITILKNHTFFKNVDAIFTIREYDALCMLGIPHFSRSHKVFLSRGDVISLIKINSPRNVTFGGKLKCRFTLWFYPVIQKIVLKFSDVVVVQAQFLMTLFQDRHLFDFNGVILNNDCPPAPQQASSESVFNLTDHRINLAFISPIWWDCKGVGVIVGAIKELEKRNVKYNFHIIGDGPDHQRMQYAINSTGENHNVIWYGWLKDIAKVMPAIDLVIVPSLYDSNPNLVLEMLALKKAVLASDIDAHKAMLVHRELLFKNTDVMDLCDRIELFYSSELERKTVSTLINQRKEKLTFNWDSRFVDIMRLDTFKKGNN